MEFNQYLLAQSKDERKIIAKTQFVQALVNGSLPQEARNYYVAQDHFYVDKFDEFFQAVFQKLPIQLQIKKPQVNGLEAEAHEALKPSPDLSNIAVGEHNVAYLQHIEHAVKTSDPIVGILALLPCTESYHLLARDFTDQADPKFKDWFDYYTSSDYVTFTNWLWQSLNILVPEYQQISNTKLAEWEAIYHLAYQDEIKFWQAVPMDLDQVEFN